MVGDACGDQAVGHGLAGRVHVALGQAHPALAVHRGQVHLARGRGRQPDVAGLADLARHDVDVDREQAAGPDRPHDRLDHGRPIAGRDRAHRVLHQVGALLVDALELERVERGLVVVAGPDVVDAALALDQQLVDVGRGPADEAVGRARIALLVAAHAHAAAAGPADIAGGERHVHQGPVGAVVVVAPDQALLVGEHGPPPLAVLGLGDPVRRLLDLVDGEAGDFGRLLQRGLVGRDRLVEAGRAGGEELLVHPALLGDVGQPGVEQREVGAGVDREVQDVVLAGLDLAGVDRDRAARVDDHDSRGRMRLARQLGFLLRRRRAAQVRDPVVQEVVGLGLERVGADGHDRVGELGVFVAVVELAHAHVAGGVDLAVVGRAVVDPDVLDLHRLEIELAGAPGVLVAAAGAAMVEGRDEQPVVALLLDHPGGDLGHQRQARRPRRSAASGRSARPWDRSAAAAGSR